VRAFHGRQGTASATANQAPGFVDPANPARTAKSPSNVVSPVTAAATMHDDLATEAVKLANGNTNVPTHPAQAPTEGQDTQETSGDSQTRAGVIIVKGAQPRGTPG
jgi:hypothetical protein